MNNKEIFSKNLLYQLKKHGITQTDLASDLNYPQTTMSNWINGKSYPRIDRIQEMADYFNIYKSDLTEDKSNEVDLSKIKNIITLDKAQYIPIIGNIACGTPIFAEENYIGRVLIDNKIIKADFVLQAQGDSMIDAGIHDSDYVFLKKTSIVDDGKIAAVLIDDEATLKRVHFYEDMIVLEACNQKYSPIVIKKNDDKKVIIMGELVGVYSTRQS